MLLLYKNVKYLVTYVQLLRYSDLHETKHFLYQFYTLEFFKKGCVLLKIDIWTRWAQMIILVKIQVLTAREQIDDIHYSILPELGFLTVGYTTLYLQQCDLQHNSKYHYHSLHQYQPPFILNGQGNFLEISGGTLKTIVMCNPHRTCIGPRNS